MVRIYFFVLMIFPLINAWAEEKKLTLWEIIRSGGIVIGILFILSIIALAIVFHCFIIIRKNYLLPTSFLESISVMLSKNEFARAKEFCEEDNSFIANIIKVGIENRTKPYERLISIVEAATLRELSFINQRLNLLANIGVISPMLGLLGTVFGMIVAFNVIAFSVEGAKPLLLAGAISKAMVTTAAGLIVAIPSLGLYFYFRSKLTRILSELEVSLEELMDYLLSSKKD